MINYKAIKLIVLDVDGTLTDGSVYIGTEGEEFKKFNIKSVLLRLKYLRRVSESVF